MADSKKNTLFKNTIMLYVLTFSTYILSFITVPYQTRVLGKDVYGLIGVSSALMVYFQLVIDFGFLLSATQEVSVNRDNPKKLSIIFTAVTINKIFLILISSIAVVFICGLVEQWRENFLFFILMFI